MREREATYTPVPKEIKLDQSIPFTHAEKKIEKTKNASLD